MRDFKKLVKEIDLKYWLAGIVLIVLAGVFYWYFHEPRRWVEVEVRVLSERSVWSSEKPSYWLADMIEKGAREYDGLGREVVRIKNVRVFERIKGRGGGIPEQGKDIFLSLEIKARLNKRKRQYVFKGKPLSTGSTIELDFTDLHLSGLVMYMPDDFEKVQREELVVVARTVDWTDHYDNTIGVPEWMADAIEVGDKMKDGRGRVLAEVLEKRVEPAKMITVAAYGVPRLSRDPLNKQVYLKLRLDTVRVRGVNYFLGDVAVKVSRGIPLYMGDYALVAEVIEIVR